MSEKWLIVGVCGVTCGGKTTLAIELNKLITNSILISQDDYFLHVDDPRHVWISELNHINFDIMSSLDMENMYRDITQLIKSTEHCSINITALDKVENLVKYKQTTTIDLINAINAKLTNIGIKLLILEGFCIFNYKLVSDLCYLKYYFTLPKDVCYKRRITRTYEPPDVPGYFEKCAWPEYLNLYEYVKMNVQDVKYIDGVLPLPLGDILYDILKVVFEL